MKIKILSLIAASLAMTLTACHDDVTPGGKDDATGQLSLSSMGIEINNAEQVVDGTRATVDLTDYQVQIADADGKEVLASTYGSMPEVMTLPTGNYTVTVSSHQVQPAEWEHPYFTGKKTFTITAQNITEIGVVTCTLQNIKVSVRYTDELRAQMADDCQVKVTVGSDASLTFTPAEMRSGYFAAVAGSSTMVAEFTGTVAGNAERLVFTATDVAAGQHRIITFKLKSSNVPDPGQMGWITVDPGVNISYDTVNENLNGDVAVGEENLGDDDRPGQESGDQPTPPQPPVPDADQISMTSDDVDFDLTNPLSNHVVVLIKADAGVSHLIVNITSDNADFMQSVGELLPTTFDLAYPGDDAAKITSLGFPVGADVIGQKAINFDISQFVPLLEAFPGLHNFKISVTDANGQQLVKTLTFKS